MISVRNFTYTYRDAEGPVLDGINLEIHRGEFVVLSGPSGCGKSTLAMAISGFLFSQYDGEASGEVLVTDQNAAKVPVYETADIVGLVQQNPESQFCTLRVEDEIVFGLENRLLDRDQIEERLNWSLAAVGLPGYRDRTLSTLSGGEKQKIALAAILAARPEMIIFDEPTSNLDPPSTREVFEVILELQQEYDLTVLVIEHKLGFFDQIQPRRLEMIQGNIKEVNGKKEKIQIPSTPIPDPGKSRESSLLAVEDLSVGLNGLKILDRINFEIQPGEFVSLLGDNGSGKSTLLLSLLGLENGGSGRVVYRGKPLSKWAVAERGQEIGLVFQNPDHQIFAQTVWKEAVFAPENFGLNPEIYKDSTRSLLTWAGLGHRLEDHPYQLSFGEKRRLNLISMLASDPSLLLLDEIFIGQDPENALYILELLQNFVRKGGSVIMVNHNPDYFSQVSTRVMFLESGKLVLDAPLKEGLVELQRLGKTSYLPGWDL